MGNTPIFVRTEDTGTVKIIIDFFKERKFDVYLTGSILETEDYNDIDMVICPEEDISLEELTNSVDSLVDKLGKTDTKKISEDYDEETGNLDFVKYSISIYKPSLIKLDLNYVSRTLEKEDAPLAKKSEEKWGTYKQKV